MELTPLLCARPHRCVWRYGRVLLSPLPHLRPPPFVHSLASIQCTAIQWVIFSGAMVNGGNEPHMNPPGRDLLCALLKSDLSVSPDPPHPLISARLHPPTTAFYLHPTRITRRWSPSSHRFAAYSIPCATSLRRVRSQPLGPPLPCRNLHRRTRIARSIRRTATPMYVISHTRQRTRASCFVTNSSLEPVIQPIPTVPTTPGPHSGPTRPRSTRKPNATSAQISIRRPEGRWGCDPATRPHLCSADETWCRSHHPPSSGGPRRRDG
jgi:hypothetical protein